MAWVWIGLGVVGLAVVLTAVLLLVRKNQRGVAAAWDDAVLLSTWQHIHDPEEPAWLATLGLPRTHRVYHHVIGKDFDAIQHRYMTYNGQSAQAVDTSIVRVEADGAGLVKRRNSFLRFFTRKPEWRIEGTLTSDQIDAAKQYPKIRWQWHGGHLYGMRSGALRPSNLEPLLEAARAVQSAQAR